MKPPVQDLRRHVITGRSMAELLAGGGGPEAVTELVAIEGSWRRLQLLAILKLVSSQREAAGPLPPFGEAWAVLVECERRAPAEVDSLLSRPQVGMWAGRVLRRLRGVLTDAAPLWMDVGYLHAVAAAAAIRGGVDFTLRIPVWWGSALVPTLGTAVLPTDESSSVAEVRCAAGRVSIRGNGVEVVVPEPPTVDADGWLAVPSVQLGARPVTSSVQIDTLDPYRRLRGTVRPEPLSPAHRSRWEKMLPAAWQIVSDHQPELAAAMTRGLYSITPLPQAGRFRAMSASAGDAFGAMTMSEPGGPLDTAVTLVHEFQHIKLGSLLHAAPLQTAEPAQRLYAPWRDDPRPLAGLLQGVYAFFGITDFWRRLRHTMAGPDRAVADFEFARWRQQVRLVLRGLAVTPELTSLGKLLVEQLLVTAEAWEEAVTLDIRAAADHAAVDHRVRWRLHHLESEPGVVTAMTEAWLAGRPPPAMDHRPRVSADPDALGLDVHGVLTLWRMTDPEGFAELRRAPASLAKAVPGAAEWDLDLVAGAPRQAAEACVAALAADPWSRAPWAGLRVAEPTDGPVPAGLTNRPELVREVYGRLRTVAHCAPDPLAIAGWLGAPATAR